MADSRPRYRSFLLRVWQAGTSTMPEWRMLLEDVVTHERHSFDDPASLTAFLEHQTRGRIQQPIALDPRAAEE